MSDDFREMVLGGLSPEAAGNVYGYVQAQKNLGAVTGSFTVDDPKRYAGAEPGSYNESEVGAHTATLRFYSRKGNTEYDYDSVAKLMDEARAVAAHQGQHPEYFQRAVLDGSPASEAYRSEHEAFNGLNETKARNIFAYVKEHDTTGQVNMNVTEIRGANGITYDIDLRSKKRPDVITDVKRLSWEGKLKTESPYHQEFKSDTITLVPTPAPEVPHSDLYNHNHAPLTVEVGGRPYTPGGNRGGRGGRG